MDNQRTIDHGIRFKPIRGLERDLTLEKTAHTEGSLLIATDTGRMWLDTPNKRIPLAGGGVNLLYGKAIDLEANASGNFVFNPKTDLENPNAKPNIGDLIVNSDGSFYRIIKIDNNNFLHCSLFRVGVGAAIWYVEMGEAVESEDSKYHIDYSELVDESFSLCEDDIIIDLKSGNFYKVYDFDDTDIRCDLMSVNGGGGGGGTGGSGGLHVVGAPKFKATEDTVSNGNEYFTFLTLYSDTEEEEPVYDEFSITFEFYSVEADGTTLITPAYTKVTKNVPQGVEYKFDAGPYLKPSQTSVITFTLNGDYDSLSDKTLKRLKNNSRSLKIYVDSADLEIAWDDSQFSNNTYFTNNVNNVKANISQLGRRVFRLYFDDLLISRQSIANGTIQSTVSVPAISETTVILREDGNSSGTTLGEVYSHGTHTLKAILSFENTKGELFESTEPITREVAVLKENKALIWVGDLKEEYEEFDTIFLPYRVYDPTSTGENHVYYWKNGAAYLEGGGYEVVSNNEVDWHYWNITGLVANENATYTISVGTGDNQAQRDFHFTVNVDHRGLGEADGAIESISAKGRSNRSSTKNRLILNNGKRVSFSNFNWYNNGWITEQQKTALKISNGASIKIPIGATSFSTSQPRTFEFRMKISNISDYSSIVTKYTRYYYEPPIGSSRTKWKDNEVFADFKIAKEKGEYQSYDAYLADKLPELRRKNTSSNYIPEYDELQYDHIETEYNLKNAIITYRDEKSNNTNIPSICFGPQDGFFTNGEDTVSVNFVEDEIFTVTLVLTGGTDFFGNNNLMKVYLNGMLTGIARSTKNESVWTIGTEDSAIEIKSSVCDIYLYNFRTYNTPLNTEQILKNYAYDNIDLKEWDFASTGITPSIDSSAPSQFSYAAMIEYNNSEAVRLGKEMPIMPYIVFTTDDSDDNRKGNLPWFKTEETGESHYDSTDMEFVNPYLDLLYERGALEDLAKAEGTQATDKHSAIEEYYLHHCPSWIATDIDLGVQGTSSEFYPRRNYKAKTSVKRQGENNTADNIKRTINGVEYTYPKYSTSKISQMTPHRGPFAESYNAWKGDTTGTIKRNEMDTFYFDNPEVGTSKFTLKIDFMESSGSYNMGLANLVNDAYALHPLDVYNNAKALCVKESDTEEEELNFKNMEYDPEAFYWYKNHKGTWKYAKNGNDEHDSGSAVGNIIINSTESLHKGPAVLAIEQADISEYKVLYCKQTEGQNKKDKGTYLQFVADGIEEKNISSESEAMSFIEKYYDKIFDFKEVNIRYKPIDRKEDFKHYRTSVQGFPTLAFHQTKSMIAAGKQPIFIGRYNMLLDKGADDAYGFTFNALQPFADGKPIKEVAECWEFENNQRGYCSFRDPWNRYDLSFTPDENAPESEKYTTNGAPIVADSFEYRYHVKSDDLDTLVLLNKRNSIAKYIITEYDNLKIDISKPEEGRKALLDIYGNWEKAVQWVWKTATDAKIKVDGILEDIPTLGKYTKIELAEALYQSNKYFVTNTTEEGKIIYIKTSEPFDEKIMYYKEISTSDGIKYEGIKLTEDIEKVYVGNKYYIQSELNDNTYILADSKTPYSAEEVYYQLVESYSLITDKDNISIEDKQNNYYVLLNGQYRRYSALTNSEKESLGENYNFYKSGIKDNPWKLNEEVKIQDFYYNYDTKEYRLQKFKTELTKHFDLEYLVTYFIITEVLECYDSRGKNCMMASWGPTEAGGDYIWFPVFYDMDTQLGINNTGIPSFDYDIDATEQGSFSTNDSILWNNLYTLFKERIKEKYSQLKGSVSSFIGPRAFKDGVEGKLNNPPFQTIEKIEQYYNGDPKLYNSTAMYGYRPLLAMNSDEEYKYINITAPITGRCDSIDRAYAPVTRGALGSKIDRPILQREDNNFFYALQGNRSMQRRQFLTNRFNYIDSWLGTGDYVRAGANRIQSRISANNSTNTSDKWVSGNNNGGLNLTINQPYFSRLVLPGEAYNAEIAEKYYKKDETANSLVLNKYTYDSTTWVSDVSKGLIYLETESGNKTHMFDGQYWIDMTPARNMYVTVGTDAANFPPLKFKGEPVRFETSDLKTGVQQSPNYREQLYYIYGLNQMKSLGDLSKLYFQEFNISGVAPKLIDLNLGYDGVDESGKGYMNKDVNDWSIPGNAGQMPLLKKVNLSNVIFKAGITKVVDLSTCDKLENFRAYGSNIAGVKFAEGVSLNTLYLPATVTDLSLIEARLLTDLVQEYQTPTIPEGESELRAIPGLYFQGLTDISESSPVTQVTGLNLQGGGLGYNSYTLLNKFVTSCKKDSGKTARRLKMTDVQWSPYKLVSAEDEKDFSAYTYYVDNTHYQLEAYTEATHGSWEILAKNGRMYYVEKEYDGTEQFNLDSSFIKDFNLLIDVSGQQDPGRFFNYGSDITKNQIPVISGIIFIDNAEEVDEGEVYNTVQKYFPDLKIFFKNSVKKGYSARFVLIDEDGVETLIGTEKLTKEQIDAGTYFMNPLLRDKNESAFDSGLIDNVSPAIDFLGWGYIENNRFLDLNKTDFSDYASNLICTYDTRWVDNLKQTSIQNWDAWCEENLANLPEEGKDFTFQAIRRYHYFETIFFGWEDQNPKIYLIKYNDPILPPSPTDLIPYKPDFNLQEEYTYKFSGWSTFENATSPNVDLSKYRSTQNYRFYPVFTQVRCDENPLSQEFFEGELLKRIPTSSYGTFEPLSTVTGYKISLKEEYINSLKGKITIPANWIVEDSKGTTSYPILEMSPPTKGASLNENVSHVFFEKNSSLIKLNQGAFSNASIQYIHLPQSLKEIGAQAFLYCTRLMTLDFSNLNVEYIGGGAFTGAFAQGLYNGTPFRIGGKVRYVSNPNTPPTAGFANNFYNDNVRITDFVLGSEGDASQLINNYYPRLSALFYNYVPIQNLTIYCTAEDRPIFEEWVSSRIPMVPLADNAQVNYIITTKG